MSRRTAFETSLTSSSQPKPAQTGSKETPVPPAVTPPDPSVAHQSIPTKTVEERAVVAANDEIALDSMEDNELCFICAEPITFWSVGICSHRTCHICAIRLRTFYKKTECTFCKTPLPSLLFVRSPSTPFPSEHQIRPSPANQIAAATVRADKLEKGVKWYTGLILPGTLDLEKFEFADEKLGVVFEDEDMMEATLLLLRFNCPADDCAHMASSWDTLERHTYAVHGAVICKMCRGQLSRFCHEQVLYPPHLSGWHDPSTLRRNQMPPRLKGPDEELVKSWGAPHPMCEFCHMGFFGPDELFVHMRKEHEECFVCKQLGDRDVYFQNYPKLDAHFQDKHYPCTQPGCLEQKFVVFASDFDLRAHMVQTHGEQMSARDRAQARQLPIDFGSQSDNRRPGPPRSQNSHGRGFTLQQTAAGSNAGPSRMRDTAPHQQQITQAPAMAPDQAAQLRRQVQKDQQEGNKRRKAFVTTLTESTRPDAPQQRRRRDDGEGLASGFATPQEDVDDATAARHAALLSRVSMLVSDSATKLASFRSAVRQFRNNESGAKDMIDTIFNVLDRDVNATTSIIREISSLFDGEGEGDKHSAVLEALNGFRVEQEQQYPSLSSGPTGMGSNWAGITSGKILNAKRVTQTTGRAGSSRSVWDRVEAAAASQPANRPAATAGTNGRYVPGAGGVAASTSSFPSLATGLTKNASTPHSTPWAGGGAGSSNKAPSALAGPQIRSVNFPTASASKSKPPSQAAFPSLPASNGKMTAAERQSLFNKPNTREESIRRITGQGTAPPAPTNGWGGGVTNGVQAMSLGETEVEEAPPTSGGGAKKKGKGKQLLFTVSARP